MRKPQSLRRAPIVNHEDQLHLTTSHAVQYTPLTRNRCRSLVRAVGGGTLKRAGGGSSYNPFSPTYQGAPQQGVKRSRMEAPVQLAVSRFSRQRAPLTQPGGRSLDMHHLDAGLSRFQPHIPVPQAENEMNENDVKFWNDGYEVDRFGSDITPTHPPFAVDSPLCSTMLSPSADSGASRTSSMPPTDTSDLIDFTRAALPTFFPPELLLTPEIMLSELYALCGDSEVDVAAIRVMTVHIRLHENAKRLADQLPTTAKFAPRPHVPPSAPPPPPKKDWLLFDKSDTNGGGSSDRGPAVVLEVEERVDERVEEKAEEKVEVASPDPILEKGLQEIAAPSPAQAEQVCRCDARASERALLLHLRFLTDACVQAKSQEVEQTRTSACRPTSASSSSSSSTSTSSSSGSSSSSSDSSSIDLLPPTFSPAFRKGSNDSKSSKGVSANGPHGDLLQELFGEVASSDLDDSSSASSDESTRDGNVSIPS